MLHRSHGVAALLLLAACTDRGVTPPPTEESLPAISANAKRPEALAKMVATALKNAELRAYLRAQLEASPYPEQKLEFRAFLSANGERALRTVATENRVSKEALTERTRSAIALEVYFPVAEHRAAWTGDERLLVATALTDDDPPIAFDTEGRRQVLNPDTPPTTPVLALVPVETDFSVRPARQACLVNCGGGDVSPPPPPPPGLYMTKSHLQQDFEGWLKGSPEFEVQILGQKGQTDSLISYQCAGEHAGGPYTFDQNGLDWSGRVLLFSKTQLDQYNTAHPNQNVRVFVVEDDDTACRIKTDPERFQKLIYSVDSAYNRLTSGNDSSTVVRKYFGYATAVYLVWQKLAALIKSNDELVGNAVKDEIVGAFYPGYNWFVKGENTITNGWINLVMY